MKIVNFLRTRRQGKSRPSASRAVATENVSGHRRNFVCSSTTAYGPLRDARHTRGDCFDVFFVDKPLNFFALHLRHWGSTRVGCVSRCLARNLEPISLNFASATRGIHAVIAFEMFGEKS